MYPSTSIPCELIEINTLVTGFPDEKRELDAVIFLQIQIQSYPDILLKRARFDLECQLSMTRSA